MIGKLSSMLRKAGAFVDVERYCGDLNKFNDDGSLREAWMDVCAQFPGASTLWRLDVTVRSTFADHPKAAIVPGVAAQAGIRAKLSRYGTTVSTISYEPLGRLAGSSADAIWCLAKEASYHRRNVSPAILYRRWRLELERALLWIQAEMALVCLGCQKHEHW